MTGRRPLVYFSQMTAAPATDGDASGPRLRHVRKGCRVDTSFVIEPVREDLKRVEEKVREAAAVDYPMLANLLSAIIGAGGKQLRPAMLLLASKI